MSLYSSSFGVPMGTLVEEEEEEDVAPLDLTAAAQPDLYPIEDLPAAPAPPLPSPSQLLTSRSQIPIASNPSAETISPPPNVVAPVVFTPPAYVSGQPDSTPFDQLHHSMEYLLPPDPRPSTGRSSRHRSRSRRSRNRRFSLFRLPCSRRLRRFWRWKSKERNVVAAASSVVVIAFLAAALVIPRWFHLSGGACRLRHLGSLDFFSLSYNDLVDQEASRKPDAPPSFSELQEPYSKSTEKIFWSDCITSRILTLMRTTIGLVFVAIFVTVVAFVLDVLGAERHPFKFVRRHAVANVIAVVIVVIVNGLAYWVSTLIREQQIGNKVQPGKKVEVGFDLSFYLIVAAGAVSVVATAANLLKQYPTEEEEQISRLVACENDDEDMEEDQDENRLRRRMRGRGDWSSLCDSRWGDTLLSTYRGVGPSSSAVLPPPYTP